MKEWKCIKVGFHNAIAEKIKEEQKDGWELHTYAISAQPMGGADHYLLFERDR